MSDEPKWHGNASEYLTPDWNGGGRVHNWRNHVGEHVRAIWHTFTDEQKRVLACEADDRASDEEWE